MRKQDKATEKKDMTTNKNSNIVFVNCTPHAISLNDGRVFEPSGNVARVAQSISDFDEDGIAVQSFGEVTGLPEPQPGTYYIVSAMVLPRAQAEGRNDVVAPATGHKDCVRNEKNFIVSVPGFLRWKMEKKEEEQSSFFFYGQINLHMLQPPGLKRLSNY